MAKSFFAAYTSVSFTQGQGGSGVIVKLVSFGVAVQYLHTTRISNLSLGTIHLHLIVVEGTLTPNPYTCMNNIDVKELPWNKYIGVFVKYSFSYNENQSHW